MITGKRLRQNAGTSRGAKCRELKSQVERLQNEVQTLDNIAHDLRVALQTKFIFALLLSW